MYHIVQPKVNMGTFSFRHLVNECSLLEQTFNDCGCELHLYHLVIVPVLHDTDNDNDNDNIARFS